MLDHSAEEHWNAGGRSADVWRISDQRHDRAVVGVHVIHRFPGWRLLDIFQFDDIRRRNLAFVAVGEDLTACYELLGERCPLSRSGGAYQTPGSDLHRT